MGNLSSYVSVGGGSTSEGGGYRPFNDMGTVTGIVNLDVSLYGSFRIVQGAGDITLNVTGLAADTAGYIELFFYRNFEYAVDFGNINLVDNGYVNGAQILKGLNQIGSFSTGGVGASDARRNPKFSPDGTKLYLVDATANLIHQYSLSIGFDISTASDDNVTLATPSSFPYGVNINNDGTKLYIAVGGNDTVYQYSLSTPFDISTATIISSFATGINIVGSVLFNGDGTKMFIASNTNGNSIHEYVLSTAFEVSTATKQAEFAFPFGVAYSLAFNKDGSGIFQVDTINRIIYSHTLSNAFDVSSISYTGYEISAPVNEDGYIELSADDISVYLFDDNNNTIYQYKPTYDVGPYFVYQIEYADNKALLNTINTGYKI